MAKHSMPADLLRRTLSPNSVQRHGAKFPTVRSYVCNVSAEFDEAQVPSLSLTHCAVE